MGTPWSIERREAFSRFMASKWADPKYRSKLKTIHSKAWKNNKKRRLLTSKRIRSVMNNPNSPLRKKLYLINAKWVELRKKYPKEVDTFIAMHKRVRSGYCDTIWPRTVKGFHAFLKYVGPAPKNMDWPSLGRKNHNKGYRPGNCGWQEMKENGLEAANRYRKKRFG